MSLPAMAAATKWRGAILRRRPIPPTPRAEERVATRAPGTRLELSLCKIHHAAFDAFILGVDPGYVIHVRRDVLEEHDGQER